MEEKEIQIALLDENKKKVLNIFLKDRGNIGSCQIGLTVWENKNLAINSEDFRNYVVAWCMYEKNQ